MEKTYTYVKLINNIEEKGILKTPIIIQAFRNIDRKDFVLREYVNEAYYDIPLPIGYNQTISQPTTVAFMMELLKPINGDNVLDIGSGSGWTTAILAEIVGETGMVTGIELIADLVDFGRNNIQKYNLNNTKIIHADKAVIGTPNKEYERILVSATCNEIPDELIQQLKIGGVLVIPKRGSLYKIFKHTKDTITQDEYPGFAFVPLR